MNRRWLRLALKLAPKGKHPHHRLGAVIVHAGRVLSKAANLARPFGIENRGRHAEERALRPWTDFTGATLFVAREGSRMSRPCDECWKKIQVSGVRRVVYFGWDSEIIEEQV
jgi:pyrimidine deaminase RibD-like protein